ncbi:MAG: colanic acid biosynthesis glycosyltransferase WcaL, partial [Planctomycetota bacterium]
MKLAYLVNQYPQPSQAFIRREIAAIETAGHAVERFTLRRFDGKLADAADEAERQKTTAVLSQGKFTLLKNALVDALTRGSFWSALGRCWRQGKQSGRGRFVHLIYLAEACTLRRLLADRGVTHVHGHFGTNAPEVALLAERLGGPSFSFTLHGPEEYDRPVQLDLAGKTAAAKFVNTVSSFGRSQLWRWASFAHWPKVKIVHCGVDDGYLQRPPEPVPESRDFVCIGRLVEQ